jgi:hypothetical protein
MGHSRAWISQLLRGAATASPEPIARAYGRLANERNMLTFSFTIGRLGITGWSETRLASTPFAEPLRTAHRMQVPLGRH